MPDATLQRTVSESDLSTTRLVAWILLGGFLFVSGFARGVYAAYGAEPSGRFELLEKAGLVALLWYWFARQLAPYRPRLVMDMGVFIVMLWFVLVPYYLWRYERWRGMVKVACLFGLFACSWGLAGATAFVLS